MPDMKDRRRSAVERTRRRLADTPAVTQLVDEGFANYDEMLERRAVYGIYEGVLLGHMEMEGSAMLVGDEAIAKRVEGRASYIWDAERLIRIIDGAMGEGAHAEYMEWIEPPAPTPFWRVETKKVNALAAKMGPAVMDAVAECKRVERMAPHLDWEERDDGNDS